MAEYRYFMHQTVLDYYDFLVYMYNTHPDSTFGTNCAYYNGIFTVTLKGKQEQQKRVNNND